MPGYNLEDLEVLVVDDNRHMRTLLRDLLRAIGTGSVLEANDGTSGFQLLRKHEPDLVITDLMMQPIDGLQFTRMVRNERRSPQPYVPIVMITGFSDKARVVEARDAGVTEFLAKPVTSEALYARIETIIERPRPFIKTNDFFGPDRRRHKAKIPVNGGRRLDDKASEGAGGQKAFPQPTTAPDTIGT